MNTCPVDYRALAELRYHIRRFLSFSERQARRAGIEPQQHQLLLALKGLPEGMRPTVGAVAERLQLRHHSTVALVDRLAARKLVARRRSDDDHREILVRITPSGDRMLGRLSVAHQTELDTAGPELMGALRRFLRGRQRTRA